MTEGRTNMGRMKRYFGIFLAMVLLFLIPAPYAVLAQENTAATQKKLTRLPDSSYLIRTNEGKTSNNRAKNDYSERNAGSTINSYIEENADGSFSRIELFDDGICVETYDKDFKLLSTKTVKKELTVFGGYYKGKDARWVLFGQNNPNEESGFESYRVVKYDMDWNKLAECPISGTNTYRPFRSGCTRMTESDGILYIHGSHLMCKSSDGVNHQSNITFVIREDTMEVLVHGDGLGYISHSFDQYVQTDGEYVYRLDLGDAYPRAVALTKRMACKDEAGIEDWSNGSNKFYHILTIPGEKGDNYTGVSLGGFELVDDYLVTAGTHAKDDESIASKAQRNIFVNVYSTDLETRFRFEYLTDYASGAGVKVRTPQTVATEDGVYVLWEEAVLTDDGTAYTAKVKLAKVGLDGKVVGKIHTLYARLSDCKPILTSDNHLLWYMTYNNAPVFYDLDLDKLDDYEFEGYITADECTITLSQYTYVHKDTGGKAQSYRPEVTVYHGDRLLTNNQEYTYNYVDNYTAGTAYVRVTMKGDFYRGTVDVPFEILLDEEEEPNTENPWWNYDPNTPGNQTTNNTENGGKQNTTSAKPAKVVGLKLRSIGARRLSVIWSKRKGVSGYQIQYALNRKFTKGKKTVVQRSNKASKLIKMKKKKTYYVRVRAYNKSNKKTYYGRWSTVKKIKVK